MKDSFSDFRKKALRNNHRENLFLHFFAAPIAPYFSFLFAKFNLSPNQVTLIFFLTGLLGTLPFLQHEPVFVLSGYFLYRFHIVFDICDGEIARYTKLYSANGAFYDFVIHSFLYPMFAMTAYIGAYWKYEKVELLMVGMLVMFAAGFGQAMKNSFYRAMWKANFKETNPSSRQKAGLFLLLKSVIKNIFNFEGFIFLFSLSVFIGDSRFLIVLGLWSSLAIVGISFLKFLRFRSKLQALDLGK
ncbi:MAG: CDP-alcohol phosphatidyltransferase family protein [Bdellovibrionales bacterium]